MSCGSAATCYPCSVYDDECSEIQTTYEAEEALVDAPTRWDAVDDLAARAHDAPSSGVVPIWGFSYGGERLGTRTPLALEVEHDGEAFFVSSKSFHVFACGSSFEEAFEEFSVQIIYFFNKYKNTPEGKTTGLATRLKIAYRESFEYHVDG